MNVTLVAHTMIVNVPTSIEGTRTGGDMTEVIFYEGAFCDSTDAEVLSEFAGRSCYQSWDKPNPKTASTADYIANIIKQEHYSVLEHASATFYIEGVSRALTHELIRHRHLSYSELSQRFVDITEADVVYPPNADWAEGMNIATSMDQARLSYSNIVDLMMRKGFTRKQAREAARAVMPNATETKIVVTGNLRAWRDFLKKRWSIHADAEICQLAGKILEELRAIAPAVFADIPETPYE